MKIEPYLFFEGRCDEAIAFYQSTLGAEVTALLRYKDSPEPYEPGTLPPGFENKVMHANLLIGEAMLMVSDGQCQGQPQFKGFGLSFTVPSPGEADRLFAALGEGGQVRMPLGKTFFSPRFGMLTDRFGVLWMIYVAP